MKKRFMPRKGKVYLLSREEREEVHVIRRVCGQTLARVRVSQT